MKTRMIKKLYTTLVLVLAFVAQAKAGSYDITAIYEDGATTVNLDLSSYITDIQNDVSGHSIQYIHFYLVSSSTNADLGNGSSTSFITYNNTYNNYTGAFTNSEGYYAYYYPAYTWDTNSLFGQDWSNGGAYNMSYTLTLPSDLAWSDIKLVVEFGYPTSNPLSEDNVINEENVAVTSTYTFSFKSSAEILAEYVSNQKYPDLSSLGTSLHEYNIVYEKDATQTSVNLSSYSTDIATDLGSSTGIQYMHFYLVDSDTESGYTFLSSVYTGDDYTFITDPTSYSNTYVQNTNANGYFVYGTNSSNYNILNPSWDGTFTMGPFTFALPSGKDWSDIKLVVVLTSDVTTIDLPAEGIIADDSTIKSAFVFSFLEKGFRHYVGQAYKNKTEEWDTTTGHKMQITHEYSFEKFLDPTTNTANLRLPIDNDDPVLEPKGYIRWYDYNDDAASSCITAGAGELGANLTSMNFASDEEGHSGENAGLFYYSTTTSTTVYPTFATTAAVQYNNASLSDEGDVIACDVSNYIDGISGGEFYSEPTLAVRFKYTIYPAKVCADRLKAAIVANPATGIYENYGNMVFGAKSDQSIFNLRTNLHKIHDYYFYNYTLSDKKITDSSQNVSGDFGTTLCQADRIIWRVYDSTGSYYKDFATSTYSSSSEFPIVDLKLETLNNNNQWYSVEGVAQTEVPQTFTTTSTAYIVALASDGTNKCPVARYTCRFTEEYPLPYDELPENRTSTYLLNNNYTNVASVTFDNLDTEWSTYAAPTKENNMNHLPSTSGWKRRTYGFVYYDLIDQKAESSSLVTGYSPGHGEYGIYKSANVPNVSKGTDNGYYWWWTGGDFYDRTYATSNGSQYGYFLYVDAAEEQRQIAEVEFSGDLCSGSTIVITAAVADMTGGQTQPQVLFSLYGLTKDANGDETGRTLLQSFASGDFQYQDATEKGVWYQVYVKTSLSEDSGVENFEDYVITIDNYARNTQGADYAVDDIQVYTKNSKVETVQSNIPCPLTEDEANLKLRMELESLQAWVGAYDGLWTFTSGSDVGYIKYYWRIVDSEGEVVTGIYTDVTIDEDGEISTTASSNNYGTAVVFSTYDYMVEQGIGETIDGIEYAIIADPVTFTMEDGKTYYISLSKELDSGVPTDWGNPNDVCSAYSPNFELERQTAGIKDVSGNAISTLSVDCNEEAVLDGDVSATLTIPDPVYGGTMTLTSEVTYTWAVVVDMDGDGEFTYTAETTYIAGEYDPDDIDYDNDYKIILNNGEASTYLIGFTYEEEYKSNDENIYIEMTLSDSMKDGDGNYVVTIYEGTDNEMQVYLCNTPPMTVMLKVAYVGPELNIGFSDVTYVSGSTRNVRMGLDQLNAVTTSGGKTLVLPLHSFVPVVEGHTFADLTLPTSIYLSDTNDPSCTVGTGIQVARITDSQFDDSDKRLDIVLNDETNYDGGNHSYITFHEGYWYELNFEISEKNESETPCFADVFFTIKVVPEYLTWTGAADSKYSTNWNNDLNWARSAKADIYSPTGYEDYGEGSYASLTTQQSYIPMKFSKVTIDPNVQTLRLSQLTAASNGIIHDLANSEFSATSDIQYDLMVMVDDDLTDATRYTCEKFYGNACQEIYFKPNSEIRYQQYLTYDKAWVEYELTPNKWYMLTSPLKDVYAGDMYVPTGSGATQGRQETAAFEAITFDSSTNSRVNYPFYQRSWDKAESLVITASDDDRSDYAADVDYTWTNEDGAEAAYSQWSHAYNDVTVPYTPNVDGAQNGFSIKANKEDVTDDSGNTVNTLIRLPKADTQYDYYKYNGEVVTPASGTQTVTKTDGQNLLMDNTSSSSNVTMTLENNSTDNGLYMISNPYMATIDMDRFFALNTNLQQAFWIVSGGEMYVVSIETDSEESTAALSATPTISPTQAFFVKLAEDATTNTVTFTTSMITRSKVSFDGYLVSVNGKKTETAAANAAIKTLSLTATYDDKTSKAKVIFNDSADEAYVENEDVETVYDSNLSDVPTLYTVASDKAVSINKLPSINIIPLGIVCASDVEATVTLTGTDNAVDGLYLLDIKEGTSTELDDSTSLTLVANDHGRYYISNTPTLMTRIGRVTADGSGSGIKCYSPAPGMITVACLSAGDTIESIDLFTVDGKKLQSIRNVESSTTTLNTYKGFKIVVVKHTGNDQAETAKVGVR